LQLLLRHGPGDKKKIGSIWGSNLIGLITYLQLGEEKSMHEENNQKGQAEQESKQMWEEPKLAFVEPKLTKQGGLKEITAGFFGTFTP